VALVVEAEPAGQGHHDGIGGAHLPAAPWEAAPMVVAATGGGSVVGAGVLGEEAPSPSSRTAMNAKTMSRVTIDAQYQARGTGRVGGRPGCSAERSAGRVCGPTGGAAWLCSSVAVMEHLLRRDGDANARARMCEIMLTVKGL
jgi:hypothetical protein